MTPVIALSGGSCVGKTSVARELSRRTHAETRLCGDVVKAHARGLGVSLDNIPENVHHQIDAETKAWAHSGEKLKIVEGRFLEHVLAGVSGVVLIRLTCSDDERSRRMLGRGVNNTRGMEMEDRHTAELAHRLYGNTPNDVPKHIIDTSTLEIGEVVDEILRYVRLS